MRHHCLYVDAFYFDLNSIVGWLRSSVQIGSAIYLMFSYIDNFLLVSSCENGASVLSMLLFMGSNKNKYVVVTKL